MKLTNMGMGFVTSRELGWDIMEFLEPGDTVWICKNVGGNITLPYEAEVLHISDYKGIKSLLVHVETHIDDYATSVTSASEIIASHKEYAEDIYDTLLKKQSDNAKRLRELFKEMKS